MIKFIFALPYWIIVLIFVIFSWKKLSKIILQVYDEYGAQAFLDLKSEKGKKIVEQVSETESFKSFFTMITLPYYLKIIPTIILIASYYIHTR